MSQNTTDNRSVFNFDTFALQVEKIDPNSFNGQTFVVDLGSVEEAVNISQGIDEDSLVTTDGILDILTDATASVKLPSTFLDNCTDPETMSEVSRRLSYSVFVSDVLFQPENRTRYKVGSIIVAAKTTCSSMNNISSSPIQATFLTSEPVSVVNIHSLFLFVDGGYRDKRACMAQITISLVYCIYKFSSCDSKVTTSS